MIPVQGLMLQWMISIIYGESHGILNETYFGMSIDFALNHPLLSYAPTTHGVCYNCLGYELTYIIHIHQEKYAQTETLIVYVSLCLQKNIIWIYSFWKYKSNSRELNYNTVSERNIYLPEKKASYFYVLFPFLKSIP